MRPIVSKLVALCLASCAACSSDAGDIGLGATTTTTTTACTIGCTGVEPDSSTPANAISDSQSPANGAVTVTSTPFSIHTLFSPYKDVSISANWNTSVISTAVTGTLTPLLQAAPAVETFTWAFATGACGAETWGGIPAATLVTANLANWVAAKKNYIVSTGGAAGTFTCDTDAGFATFLDRYASPQFAGVDFDIEAGQTPAVIAELVQRVKVAQTSPKYAGLRFSFTLATLGGNTPQSLGPMGQAVMAAIGVAGLKNVYINLMAMDYGSASSTNCTLAADGTCQMGLSAIQAANNLNEAYGTDYRHIELTAMVGGNDTPNETFTLGDVASVLAYAKEKSLGGLHIWSLDRDTDCPAGWASPTCNSYGQAGTLGFTKKFLGL